MKTSKQLLEMQAEILRKKGKKPSAINQILGNIFKFKKEKGKTKAVLLNW